MKKNIILGSLILIFFLTIVTVFVMDSNKSKRNDNPSENANSGLSNNSNNEEDRDKIEEEPINIKNSTTPPINGEATNNDSDKSKSNNSNNSVSKNTEKSSNGQTSNNANNKEQQITQPTQPAPEPINQTPVWNWMKNDFPVSKYGTKEATFNACDKKGEEKIIVKEIVDGVEQENIKYSFYCTDVTNVDGIFIGYMLRLRELNTGVDYNWR